MNTKLASLIPLLALGSTVAFAILPASAKDSDSRDRAARLLAQQGSVNVSSVGPYVETGTYAIQVASKLGQPTVKLPDGTWLYHGFHVEDSGASGSLVVRFSNGRVSKLSLVTPVVATAMLTPAQPPAKILASSGR